MKPADVVDAIANALSNLKSPGVGLRGFESIVLKYLGVPIGSIGLGRAAAEKMFLREGERLLYLAQDVDEWILEQRVHVRRVPGMEECSCHWSMEQLVEHNITTGVGIARTLQRLLKSSIPECDVNVVNANPVGGRRAEIRTALQDFLHRFSSEFSGVHFLRTRHAMHPSFGKLNAEQWFRLAAVNNLVHRVHGERIFERLLHTDLTQ